MKGQIYMMLGLFLILAIIMLQVYTHYSPDYYNPEISREYLHLKGEIEKTAELAILNEVSAAEALDAFSAFADDYCSGRGYIFTMSYDATDQSSIAVNLRLEDQNSYLEDKYTISRMIS